MRARGDHATNRVVTYVGPDPPHSPPSLSTVPLRNRIGWFGSRCQARLRSRRVRAAAAQKIPGYPKETNAVVLLSETNYSVAPDGRATEHFRTVIKVLRPQGREDAIIVIPFDKDTKILSLHAWSIGPDGHEYVVKDNEFAEIGYPGQGNYYEDIKAKVTRPPGRDPGGIIAYEYEQRIRPYLTEKTWFFQDDIPRLHQTFTLELPPGYTYGTVWAHHAQSQAADLEHQRWR